MSSETDIFGDAASGDGAQKPVIGISLGGDYHSEIDGLDAYQIRKAFFERITAAGGAPIGLPHLTAHVETHLSVVDGVLIPSGDVKFPDDWYTEGSTSPYEQDSGRLAYEIRLVEACLQRNIPVLGVCHGMQILGRLIGGRLAGDYRELVGETCIHRDNDKTIPGQPTHAVNVVDDGWFSNCFEDAGETVVVSNHNEIIADPGDANVMARAPDGVIEAIAAPGADFAVGVQWHAELGDAAANEKIFGAFVAAARRCRRNRFAGVATDATRVS